MASFRHYPQARKSISAPEFKNLLELMFRFDQDLIYLFLSTLKYRRYSFDEFRGLLQRFLAAHKVPFRSNFDGKNAK